MTNTWRNRLLIGATATVMAMATIGAPQAASVTPTYRLGFVDGCDVAKQQAGYPLMAGPKRLAGNAEYEGAWRDGYGFCMFSAQQEQNRILPGPGPHPDD